MGRLPSDYPGTPASDLSRYLDGKTDCSFCGKRRATGFWAGDENVLCCRDCATLVLPALIVDAIALPGLGPTLEHFEKALPQIHAAYWKAVASLACAELRDSREARHEAGPTTATTTGALAP